MAPSPTRFRKTRRTVLIIAATGVTAALVVPPAVGGTGIGAIFNLGKTNTVNAPTVLTGANVTRMLQVTNSGTGSALSLTTKTNVAPLRVNSSTKVTNLNADKLDGKDSTAFMAANARPDANTLDGKDSTAFMAANARPDANTLDGKDSTAFAPATGQTLVTVPGANWFKFNDSDPTTFSNFSSFTAWTRTSAGTSFLAAAPDLTAVMNGRGLLLKGVQFCYTASTSATLTYAELNTTSSTTGAGNRQLRLSDATDRTDSACRVYALPTPIAITPSDGVNFFAQVSWVDQFAQFNIGRATFIFDAAPTPLAPVSLSSLVTTTTTTGPAPAGGTAAR
jgi:hypothetical protein